MQFPPINIAGEGPLYACLVTSFGDIIVRLEEQRAPATVQNFVALATGTIEWKDPKTGAAMNGQSLYNGVRFHRVTPKFTIQCGDPFTRYADLVSRWGTGGPGYKFQDEFHPELRHDHAGVLSMANVGPATNGSQWFITEMATPHLNDRNTIFGYVIVGMNVVSKISNVPTTQGRPNTDVILREVRIFRESMA